MVEQLKSLIKTHSKERQSLLLKDICRSLNVHVSQARRLLEELVAKKCPEVSDFEAIYNITGFDEEVDGCRLHKFKTATASELEEKKKDFASIVSCQINGILFGEGSIDYSSTSICSEEQMKMEQKLTGIINDELGIRQDLKEYYLPILKKKRDENDGVDGDEKSQKKMKVEKESIQEKQIDGKKFKPEKREEKKCKLEKEIEKMDVPEEQDDEEKCPPKKQDDVKKCKSEKQVEKKCKLEKEVEKMDIPEDQDDEKKCPPKKQDDDEKKCIAEKQVEKKCKPEKQLEKKSLPEKQVDKKKSFPEKQSVSKKVSKPINGTSITDFFKPGVKTGATKKSN